MSKNFVRTGLILLAMVSCANGTLFHKKCESDKTCAELFNEHYMCVEGFCKHEELWPLNLQRVAGIVLLVFVAAFANAGGIGGGAIIVPLYIVAFSYTVGEAIPMAKATILSGALVTFSIIITKRHPTDRSSLLIDFQMAAVIIPSLLAGTVIGVLLMKVLPPIIIMVILLSYLVVTIYNLVKKAIKESRKELAEAQTQEEASRAAAAASALELANLNVSVQSSVSCNEVDVSSLAKEAGAATRPAERSFCYLICRNFWSLLICGCGYLNVLVFALLRGGRGMESIIGVDSCSAESFALLGACQVIGLMFATLGLALKAKRLGQSGKDDSVAWQEGRRLLLKAYFAGILSGMVGMGGGIIINPVLLNMGIRPEVSAALSGFVVLFSSSSTTSQFLIAGAFDFKQAFFILMISAVGSLIGALVVSKWIERHHRPSILIWILLALMVASGLSLPVVGLMQIMTHSGILTFSYPC